MWHWGRVVAKHAVAGSALLFALQAISAPGLCAMHDRTSTPTETSDRVEPQGTKQVGEAAESLRIADQGAGQSQHDDTGLGRCDVPTLLSADTQAPAAGSFSIILDMAPAWHQATLQNLSSDRAIPARWARRAPPPQISPLDIAPRLRI